MNEQDSLRRFVFEKLGVRGEWVSLTKSWQAAKEPQQAAPEALIQLGQALVAATLLSATVKFNGSLILQLQGDGALKTVVAQATHDRHIRGLAHGSADLMPGTLQDMYGQGYLVLTIKSTNAEPYQGIVTLEGKQLSDALETYFAQSEQLPTRLWLFANQTQAAGLFLQELPGVIHQRDDWERICLLAETVTPEELFNLPCEELLYRLFNQDEITLFDAEAVQFSCHCSQQKIEQTLFSLGRQDLEALLSERGGSISVNCEFCARHYEFDAIDVEKLLVDGAAAAEKLH